MTETKLRYNGQHQHLENRSWEASTTKPPQPKQYRMQLCSMHPLNNGQLVLSAPVHLLHGAKGLELTKAQTSWHRQNYQTNMKA